MDDHSTQSAANSIAEQVETDVYGVVISKNCTTLSSRLGSLVRTHIPVCYTDWKKVPMKYKDDVWNELVREYEIPPSSKRLILRKMAEMNRGRKWSLRQKNFAPSSTLEERKKKLPSNVREEDWVRFCENEETEKLKKMKSQNKINRSKLGYNHATGRVPHARNAALIEKDCGDVGPALKRVRVWAKNHMRHDGTILPSAAPIMEKILKQLETEPEDSLSAQDLETDAISRSVGKSSRGRTIAYALVSTTQIKAAAPVLAKLASYKSKANELEAKVTSLEEILVTRLGNVESRLDDIFGNHQQHTQPSSASGSNCSAPAFEHAHYTKCELHNIADEVIAYGRLVKDKTAGVVHGNSVPLTEEKVLLDKIFLPMEKLSKVNHGFAETFVEIGVGGYVAHPKFLIHYM